MNIYVAGSSAELDRVASFIARLREAGHTITYDWPHAIFASGMKANDLPVEQAVHAAISCEEGVKRADLFVLLAPVTPTIGTWVEFGHARAYCVSCVIVGERPVSIFCAGWDCMTEGDLFAKLRGE